MMSTSTAPVTAETLAVPGARLHYELRGSGPLVALVAAPMDATSFEPLADLLLDDYTVLTTDPRGINRSSVADRDRDSTPEHRAEDLSRLLAHLDAGPAVVLGSSGGAVTALAHAQAHPEQVHTVIAHEPPIYDLLDDRGERLTGLEDTIETYRSGDSAGAWGKFLANANITMTADELAAVFPGELDPQAVADERYGFLHMLRATCRWVPDIEALRGGSPRIVIGIGEESTGQLCDRTSRALAARLSSQPTLFPGDHLGFLEDPAGFAVQLRAVLHG